MKLQVTFFHNENKYKPMSTILEIENMQEYNDNKAEIQKKALLTIGHYRHQTPQEIIKNGYTKVKIREYDIEKIKAQQEQQHRVNLLKYIERKRKERLDK